MKLCFMCALLLVGSISRAAQPGAACLGQVVAGERSIILAAPSGSVVGELFVKRGEKVEAGAELARLRDYDIYKAATERARLEITYAQATLELVRAGEREEVVDAQRSELTAREASFLMYERRKERYASLQTNQFVSADEFEDVAHNHDLARAEFARAKNVLKGLLAGRAEEVKKAEARLSVAEAEYEQELARLEAQRIRAPIAGEILAIQAYQGEAIGDEGVFEIADTDNMMILAEVYETDIKRIKHGQRVKIRAVALGEETDGSVVEIERHVRTSRVFPLDPLVRADRRTIPVRIKPDNPEKFAGLNNAQVMIIFLAQ